MATLLHIDTAGEKAMVAISQNGVLLAIQENEVFQTHASFLQVAIQTLVAETAIPLNSIDAIRLNDIQTLFMCKCFIDRLNVCLVNRITYW